MLKHTLMVMALAGLGTAQQVNHEYHIYNTGGLGAKVRSCSKTACRKVGWLSQGSPVTVYCQVLDEVVSDGKYSSAVWDQLSDGGFVSDLYVDTLFIGRFTPGIKRCGQ